MLFPLKKQSNKVFKHELEELHTVHGHEKRTPALSTCTNSRKMKWGNDICREKHLIWDSTKNMGCKHTLCSWRVKCNMVSHFHSHNSTDFSILQCYTLKTKKHLFSPFQSMYLNFCNKGPGTVTDTRQDFVFVKALWFHWWGTCPSTCFRWQVLPEVSTDAEIVAESNHICSNTCNKST